MATKRNAAKFDSTNPLLAANPHPAKKPRKDVASTKRKYPEETPGAPFIVHEPRNDALRQPTPAKKFKADGLSVPQQQTRNLHVHPVVEKDVREMEDEADRLLRASRALVNQSINRANTTQHTSPSSMSFRPSSTAKPPPKSKSGKSKKAVAIIVDEEVPLLDGTPQAERNKLLRGDAMADPKTHQRRTSLGGRGKRISSSFQAGAFTLPHPKVNEDSFYKHIDRDLPDAEQLRQLLTWSASRAAASFTSASSSSLPREDASAIRSITDDMVRMVAERRLDLSLFAPDDEAAPTGTNSQNEKNKQWDATYTQQLHEAQEEDEEWKKTAYFYEAYTARERRRIDERRHAPRTALPDERQLNERLRHGLRLANAPPDADPGGLAAQIRTRLPDLQFKFDMLHMNLHAARTCARVAGRALDTRFGLLDAGLGGLAARTRAQTNAEAGPSGVAATATHEVLRALASVDMERPLTKVGDAARRAARLQGPIEFA
ncbi:Mis12-Mtw1 protein family-domain-containing protein [Mycena olivaceomarginata]|nr:Mis12-Mtw1 protein family-domain-containing protein [Mycena olivaceomarginata]